MNKRTLGIAAATVVVIIVLASSRTSSSSTNIARPISSVASLSGTTSSLPERSLAVSFAPRRILAFGDSLTEGFYSRGTQWHPYTIKLTDLLRGAGDNSEVVNEGYSGETTPQMNQRLPRILAAEKFDVIVILGGTNDFRTAPSADAVFRRIVQLHNIAKAHGAKSGVVTIPQMSWRKSADFEAELRHEINKKLREFAASNPETTFLVELADNTKQDEHPRWWDDGIHYTPEGYDYFGSLVFEALPRRS